MGLTAERMTSLVDPLHPQVAILGSILLDPSLMSEAMTELKAEDFSAANCRLLWQTMVRLFREGKPLDAVTVRNALTGFDGATQLIIDCMDLTPTTANFRNYIAICREQAMLAQLKELGAVLSEAKDLTEALALIDKGNSVSVSRRARERRTMTQMLQSFADRHADQKTPDHIPWPFKPLRDGIKVEKGKYIVIGGYPSDGKTAFALACGFCQAAKYRCAFYSYETDANTVEDRILASVAQINMEHIQSNALEQSEWDRYAEASAEAASLPLDCIAAAGMTTDDIRADALAHRYQIIYVDYLQLINPGRRGRNESRFDAVTQISMELQQIAKTTGITVVALSQMTRPAADKKGNVPEPTMHNLRESGQIEQDADVIMLLYRQDQKNIRAPRKLGIVKNKEGRTGRFWLDFDGQYQRFSLGHDPDSKGFPLTKKKPHKTPVLNEAQEQQSFAELIAPDPDCPF